MAADRRENGVLDPTNRRILLELQSDARLTLAELGRRVGLSAPAVGERVGRLESAGVIAGYRVELDPRALGYELAAVLRIRPAPRQIAAVAELDRFTPYGQTTTSIVQSSPVPGRGVPLQLTPA